MKVIKIVQIRNFKSVFNELNTQIDKLYGIIKNEKFEIIGEGYIQTIYLADDQIFCIQNHLDMLFEYDKLKNFLDNEYEKDFDKNLNKTIYGINGKNCYFNEIIKLSF